MVLEKIGTNNQQTRDELTSEPDTQPIVKIKSEKLVVEENATKVSQEYIGNSFIVGHPVNGILGVANGVNGEQIVLGEAGRSVTVLRVTSPNNTFRERFNFNTFEDTSTTTATWGSGELDFSSSAEIAQTTEIFLNLQTIKSAIVTLEGTDTENAFIYLSADGGTTYQSFDQDTETAFTVTGQDLRCRIYNYDPTGGSDTRITEDGNTRITEDGNTRIINSTSFSAQSLTITLLQIKYFI